ncbi:hypothetical protein [Marinitenerispora sediminis]|nr:hypothetical protein [Marinitenerispora sediminis]
MDYELGRRFSPLYVSHVAVSDGRWIGPELEPPAPPTPARLTLGMPI